VPIFKGLKVCVWNHYSLSLETNVVFQVLANYPNPYNLFVLLLTLYSELRLVMTWIQNQFYSTWRFSLNQTIN